MTDNGEILQDAAVESYLLLIHLVNSENPVITRLLSVPSNLNFVKFHHVLQVAFGWASCHAHSFSVSKLLEDGEVGFLLHYATVKTLCADDPRFRQISVPTS